MIPPPSADPARFPAVIETAAVEALAELYEAWGLCADATRLRTVIAGQKEKRSD